MLVTELQVEGVRTDPYEHVLLTAGICERAVARTQDGLRDGLEEPYRELARTEDDEARRHARVDRADAVRRWSLR